MDYKIKYKDEIYHHGIKGQKWGQRNGPPYPLGSDDYSVREKREQYKQARKESKGAKRAYKRAINKAYYLSSNKALKEAKLKESMSISAEKAAQIAKDKYKEAKHERSNKEISNILGVSEKEADHIRKVLKIAGISLATTAGLVAAGYLISRNRETLKNLPGTLISEGKRVLGLEDKVININSSGAKHTFKLADKTLFSGDVVGGNAAAHGYGKIGADYIKQAIENPTVHGNAASLVRDVRINQVGAGGYRRLSCWSTSQSYFLSTLTGKDFCSMSYENLVDFNDFKNLYKTQPKIFDAFGKPATDFVGKFGRDKARIKFDEAKGKELINHIFNNISEANNLTADGKKTVGFINAGYRGITCTHEWNFEIIKQGNGTRLLQIVDGYSGDSYPVAIQSVKGVVNTVKMDGQVKDWSHFMQELHHYNADSLRFYAPSLDSVNPEAMAKVILGKK